MMKPKRAKTPGRKTPAKFSSNKDPIVVYCRIRPLFTSERVCIKPKDKHTIVLSPPEETQFIRSVKEYTFSYVFGEDTTQKKLFDCVALPLVKDLLQGSNGLLFTYGITSSGKTYTMSGDSEDGGLLPRTLDVIFNSITDYQAEKYIYKLDKFNGFEIQSNEEAMRERLREPSFLPRTPRPKGKDMYKWSNRVSDTSTIDVSSDMKYSVFISYVEIYNNYIYDLLEDISDDSIKKKSFTSKILREDSKHNMYVFGVSENEVKTADEALELFVKGQVRRKIASTALNTESSRSHSVFTIRVVQAPLDAIGQNIIQDRDQMIVSQLSLVDLAGSERAQRTRCNSQRNQREAGNINASLMALRVCIEALRDSQNGSVAVDKIRYRDSKLTHLFKTFFEGEGKVRMVVCVNPREDDYEENLHVMKFAEMSQEVLITRPTPVSTPTVPGLRSGRGNLYLEAIQRAKEHGLSVQEVLAPIVYSLPEFPMSLLEDEESCDSLIDFLDSYIARKQSFVQDVERRQTDFRNRLIEIDSEMTEYRNRIALLDKDFQARNNQVLIYERKLTDYESHINRLERQCLESNNQLSEKGEIISQLRHENSEIRAENQRNKAKMHEKLENEKDKWRRIMERRIAQKEAELEGKLCFNGEKMRLLREIMNAGEWDDLLDVNGPPLPSVPSSGPSDVSVPQTRSRKRSSVTESSNTEVKMPVSRSTNDLVGASKKLRSQQSSQESKNDFDSLFAKENKPPGSSQRSLAIANLRHRRSQSSSGDVWVEHKPVGNLELNTVLQPKMKKRRSVSKLKVADVINKDASKYVLEHQEQDSQGEVETQLFKGDIIPSAGGGAQVVFNDVEKLRQASPPSAPYNFRKRSSEGLPLREIEDRCTVAVECHGYPSKVMKKK